MRFAPALILVIGLAFGSLTQAADGKLRVYFGTFVEGPRDGIFVAEMDLASGAVSEPRLAAVAAMPAFLAVAPDRKHLYAVSEVSNFERKKSGGVVAWTIDERTGRLTLLNRQLSQGTHPCHIVVDKAGKHAFVANYYGGTTAVFPIDENGRLKYPSSVEQNKGHGVNRERQEGPHAHSINLDPANRFVFVCDLGLDKVFSYRFDPVSGKHWPKVNDPSAVDLPPGSGPRHMAFHPSGRFAYVINEMGSTITAFWYDAETGILSRAQTVSTLPAGFKGTNTSAEVAVHPNGKFVYGSNRGHDSIAIFSVDPVTGRLTAAGHERTQGKTPRGFGIDPSGAYLLVANQDSNNVVMFRIDASSGKLTPTGQTVKVHQPCCVVFAGM